MISKIIPFIFVLCVGLIIFASWIMLIAPEFKNADQNFELRLETLEHWEIRESLESDKFEEQLARGEVKLEVIEKNGNELKLKYTENSADIISDEVYWDVEEITVIDKHSRKSIETDSYFLFPINTQKQNYKFGVFGDRPHNFSFVKTEKLNGLEIYEFRATNIYDISGAYAEFPNEIILADQTTIYQIEPFTGQIVSYHSFWQDFIDGADGRIVISKGDAEISQYSKDILVHKVSNMVALYQIYDNVIPIIMIVSIISAEGFMVMFHKLQERKKEIKTSKLVAIGELSARFSHDIRNPLSNINMALRSIEKDRESNLNNNTKEKFEIISRNFKRISHQVDGVLDFIRIHPLKKEKLSLKSLLRESVDAIFVPKHIEIVLPPNDDFIFGDSVQLQIVCRNIITNAIQAIDKEEGKIIVRKKEDPKNVFLEFEDSGPGFSSINKKEIFDVLSTSKQTGTGLGLVSCKQIVENHGGTITIKENPTTFVIKLPKK
jgi:signal transduction histidine kinase